MIVELALSLLTTLRPDAVHLTPEAVNLGGRVVAAEARSESFGEQVSVAAVIGNRVRCGSRMWGGHVDDNPWIGVMSAPYQFAAPAPRSITKPHHRLAFIVGALAPAGWRGQAMFFATQSAAKRGFTERRALDGYLPIDETMSGPHVYYGREGE